MTRENLMLLTGRRKLRFCTGTPEMMPTQDRILCQVIEEGSSLKLIDKHIYCSAIFWESRKIQICLDNIRRGNKYVNSKRRHLNTEC